MFFMSFESQTSVCAFNCVQTPIFSGPFWRSRADKASVGDRCSNGPVPVCLSQLGLSPGCLEGPIKKQPKKMVENILQKGEKC